MYQPIALPQVNTPQVDRFSLDRITGGYCITDIEQNLADNQSPKLRNMWWNGTLSKRNGQTWLNVTPIEAHPILQMYIYNDLIIYHCNTTLYKCTLAGVSTSIFTGLSTTKGTFFEFNSNLYYKEGTKYVQWNGTTATEVVAYIPTIYINCIPLSGKGDTSEGVNRIGAGFKVSFNGDGTATYQMPPELLPLDATAITASIDKGVTFNKVETTHFTVNRTTGVVTWLSSPTTGIDNVVIKAYFTNSTVLATIIGATVSTIYGGTNSGINDGTRVILANGKVMFYSAVENSSYNAATYFPYDNFQLIGTSEEDITAFGKAYNILVAFKAHSTHGITYDFNGTDVMFPTSTINDKIGCDMPYTVQLVDNKLVWWNTYAGCFILASTNILDERNVLPISYNINGTATRTGALQESLSDKQNAVSCDSNGRYWTCIGNKVYLWDYSISPYANSGDTLGNAKALSWFYFDNINANCFVMNNQDLYYGDKTTGKISKFVNALNDFGSAINSVYRFPLRDFKAYEWLKTIKDLHISCRADTSTEISMAYITEKEPNGRIESNDILVNTFSWLFSWATFSWDNSSYVKQFRRRPNCKNVDLFGIEFTNNSVDRDMSILSIVFPYTLSKKVK